MTSPTLLAFTEDYLTSLKIEHGYSDHTISNYGHYLDRLYDAIGGVRLCDIDLLSVKRYRTYLNNLGLSLNTQTFHLMALRGMLKYAARQGYTVLNSDAVVLAKLRNTITSFLEPAEVVMLLDAPDTTTTLGLRDRTVLELLFATGLRVHELTSLKTKQINLDRGDFTIVGKGNKIRTVYLTPRATEWLIQYLETHEADALFECSDRHIQRIVHQYATEVGITKHVTPHTLRHSMATNLLTNGCDIRSVQELLGHASIATTQIYTHITSPQLKANHAKYNTLAIA